MYTNIIENQEKIARILGWLMFVYVWIVADSPVDMIEMGCSQFSRKSEAQKWRHERYRRKIMFRAHTVRHRRRKHDGEHDETLFLFLEYYSVLGKIEKVLTI